MHVHTASKEQKVPGIDMISHDNHLIPKSYYCVPFVTCTRSFESKGSEHNMMHVCTVVEGTLGSWH